MVQADPPSSRSKKQGKKGPGNIDRASGSKKKAKKGSRIDEGSRIDDQASTNDKSDSIRAAKHKTYYAK